LSQDGVRAAHHICGCEAEQPDPGREKPILAAIVLDDAR